MNSGSPPFNIAIDNLQTVPLMTWPATAFEVASASDVGAAMFEDELTAVRVRGSILWYFPELPATATMVAAIHFRVRVAEADPITAQTPTPLTYDLESTITANEDFLWEHHEVPIVNLASWGEQQMTMKMYGKVDVDVRSQRRLRQNETLSLVTQFSAWNAAAVTSMQDLFYVPRLRTLMRETN